MAGKMKAGLTKAAVRLVKAHGWSNEVIALALGINIKRASRIARGRRFATEAEFAALKKLIDG